LLAGNAAGSLVSLPASGFGATQSGVKVMSAVIRFLLSTGLLVLLAGCDEALKTEIVPIPQNAVPSALVVEVNRQDCYHTRMLLLDAANSYDPDGGEIDLTWEVAVEPEDSRLSEQLAGEGRAEVLALLEHAGDYRLRVRATGEGGRVKVSPWINHRVYDNANDPYYSGGFCQVPGSGIATQGASLIKSVSKDTAVELSAPGVPAADIAYRWVLLGAAEGSSATLVGDDLPVLSFTADKAGTYSVALEMSRDEVVQAVAMYRVDVLESTDLIIQDIASGEFDQADVLPGTRKLVIYGGRELGTLDIDTSETHALRLPGEARSLVFSPAGTRALVLLDTGIALVGFDAGVPTLLWNRSVLEAPYQQYTDALWLSDERALVVSRSATSSSYSYPKLHLFLEADRSLALLSDTFFGYSSEPDLLGFDGFSFYWASGSSLRRKGISVLGELQTAPTADVTFVPCLYSSNPGFVFLSGERVAACGVLFSLGATGVPAPLHIIDFPSSYDLWTMKLASDGSAMYVLGRYDYSLWRVDALADNEPERTSLPQRLPPSHPDAPNRYLEPVKILSTPELPLAVLMRGQGCCYDNGNGPGLYLVR
jgi:hypothetical protein